MQYWVYLKKNGEPELFQDGILDFIPKRTFDLMEVNQVPEKLGLCEHCDLDTVCHVMEDIGELTSRKLCPILFYDVVRPRWKLSDLT